MCVCLLHTPYYGPGLQPRMCPDWESNLQPFGSQAGTQSTEPHQPGESNFLHQVMAEASFLVKLWQIVCHCSHAM